MRKYIVLAIIALCFYACEKDENKTNIPDCIQDKITSFEKNYACQDGASVKKYTFQNKTVFVFDPGTCGADMAAEVVDIDCTTLGYLGGIAGNTEINSEDFSNAVYQETIWEN